MIYYENSRLRFFARLRGSILPQAILFSTPPAIFAMVLKICDNFGYIVLSDWWSIEDRSVLRNFTFALTFCLVFRTNESYKRFWNAANNLKHMQAHFYDAITTIVCFSLTSKRPKLERVRFQHELVRLFSLLHGVVMEDLSNLEDENYPLIDISALSAEELEILQGTKNEGMKPEIVLNWIRLKIIGGLGTGLVAAPPPILTRVFHRLGAGLTQLHAAKQVMEMHFPFPYVQSNILLVLLYGFLTPLQIASKTQYWFSAAGLTLFSISCLKAIDLIAIEIDAPFGEDPNDLPMWELHKEFLSDLFTLINPASWKLPLMMTGAKLSYEEMVGTFSREDDGTLGWSRCGCLKSKNIKEEVREVLPHQFKQLDMRLTEEDYLPEAVKQEEGFQWQPFLEELSQQLRVQWQQDMAAMQRQNEQVEQQCTEVLQMAVQQLQAPRVHAVQPVPVLPVGQPVMESRL